MPKPLSEMKRKASPERQLQTEREVRELLEQISEQEAKKAIQAGTNRVIRSSDSNMMQASSSLSVEALERYVFSLGAMLELRAVFPDRTVKIELVDATTDKTQDKAA